MVNISMKPKMISINDPHNLLPSICNNKRSHLKLIIQMSKMNNIQ